MQQQVKIWHLILSFFIGIVSCAVMVFNTGKQSGEFIQKTNMTLDYHQKQINEIKVNAEVDRREYRQSFEKIDMRLVDIQLMLKDKQDRDK